MNRSRLQFFFVLILSLSIAPVTATGQVPLHLTLEDIYASRLFSGNTFSDGRWAANGPVIRYTTANDAGTATDLVVYNLETDAKRTLIHGQNLFADDVGRTIWIDDYSISPDGSRILIYTDSERVWRLPTKGFYYIYDVKSKTLTPLADRDAGYQMFAKFSPSSDEVAFVRQRNLYVVSLRDMSERALTTSGREGLFINGTFDWVYEEEFGLRDGWEWSPDGKKIAFFNLDESQTRDFTMSDLRDFDPSYRRFRYPKAGQSNSEVRVGVIRVDSGSVTYMETDTWRSGSTDHEYIARMGWTPSRSGASPSQVWMLRLNRDQNEVDLLLGDVHSGETRRILHEADPTWVNLPADKIVYLSDHEHFLWQSETSGHNHLYLYENSGHQVGPITSGAWDVTEFHGLDVESGTAFFSATIESPLERQLYAVQVDTHTKDASKLASIPRRITSKSGTHHVNLSADTHYYIDRFSDVDTPTRWSLQSEDGSLLRVLEPNKKVNARVAEYGLPRPEFGRIPGEDGTMLNTYVIRPTDFDSTRLYPLLMYVYGGPGVQTVTNSWGGSRYLWHAYLAEELDVIVASVDNRGTGGRGRAFNRAPYKRLGVLEAEDQIAVARTLGSRSYIDEHRVGIWGWSYGGFMTLMSMLTGDGPDVFKTGISVAPVTDWRLYDTIYTERYMSTPTANPDGYKESSPRNWANRLSKEQHLLIIHGDQDDNVHFQHSVQMIAALQAANKQFSFMLYPGKNHDLSGGLTRLNLFTKMTDFLRDNL